MVEKKERFSFAIIGALILLCGFAIGNLSSYRFGGWRQEHAVREHIKANANKNCNDCHLGQSWVNVLNNQIVRDTKINNVPLVEDILIRAKVKVY